MPWFQDDPARRLPVEGPAFDRDFVKSPWTTFRGFNHVRIYFSIDRDYEIDLR